MNGNCFREGALPGSALPPECDTQTVKADIRIRHKNLVFLERRLRGVSGGPWFVTAAAAVWQRDLIGAQWGDRKRQMMD
jgi:hypothetical protein